MNWHDKGFSSVGVGTRFLTPEQKAHLLTTSQKKKLILCKADSAGFFVRFLNEDERCFNHFEPNTKKDLCRGSNPRQLFQTKKTSVLGGDTNGIFLFLSSIRPHYQS